jgi:predicted  nucleic acid-binding Zn-ribbon protein
MSLSSTLYRLQQTDTHLDQSRQRLQIIAQTLEQNDAIRQATALEEQAQAHLQAVRKAQRQAEEAVQSQNIKIELTESSLYGGKVRNPKELQDLQSESASLKRYLETLEERLLETMLAFEDAEAKLKVAEQALQETIARVSEQHAGLKGEQTALKQDVERLEVERQAILSSVSPNELTLYERLRQQRRGVAVAKISNRACGACGSTLNTAVGQAAASANQLAHCPTCGRILYAG